MDGIEKNFSEIRQTLAVKSVAGHNLDQEGISPLSEGFITVFLYFYSPQILIVTSLQYILIFMRAIPLLVLALLLTFALAQRNQAHHSGEYDGRSRHEASNVQTHPPAKGIHHELPAKAHRNSDNIYDFVDNAIKEKYWYYLTKACLLYLTSVEQGKSYQFLAIYRNIVGTFLAITTWQKGASDFQVNTLVRLGDGGAPNSGVNYKPVKVHPLALRYTLGSGEVLIDITDCGDIHVNGKSIWEKKEDHQASESSEDLLVKQCKEFSDFARAKFWYYLDHANVIYSTVAKSDKRQYCLITYLNVAGTFLVIGNCDKSSKHQKPQVDTFVRLGNGFAENSGANYKPVPFNKISLRLGDYDSYN